MRDGLTNTWEAVFISDSLSRFSRFENEVRNNTYIMVTPCRGRHCIRLHGRPGCPAGRLALSFILRDFRAGVYDGMVCMELANGLEVCLAD